MRRRSVSTSIMDSYGQWPVVQLNPDAHQTITVAVEDLDEIPPHETRPQAQSFDASALERPHLLSRTSTPSLSNFSALTGPPSRPETINSGLSSPGSTNTQVKQTYFPRHLYALDGAKPPPGSVYQDYLKPVQRPRPTPHHGPPEVIAEPEQTEWIKKPICEHCGSMVPRAGATTVYGTKIKGSHSFLDLTVREKSVDSNSSSESTAITEKTENMKKRMPRKNSVLCLVEKVHEQDDVNFLPKWKRILHTLLPIASMLGVGSYWVYFIYRIICTRAAERIAHKTYGMAWTFIAVEFGVAMPMLTHQCWQCFLFKRRFREKIRVVGDETPTVDVFITCCGEDNDIVIDTVRAAAAQDWPNDSFRVIVLDDKHDLELERKIQEMGVAQPHVYYHARVKIKGVPHHFKAGNLNGGLDFVKTLEGGAGEYMAALDADMIPEPQWLRAIIAHLVLDPELALSCPPQLFYNVPKNDPLLQSLNAFVHIAEPIKDAAGVAWCTGSGYSIRRSAIDEIGGFPTGSLAEDVCTSSMLLGAGWKTAYIHEALQYGTVPDSFVGHMKQRIRWTIGTIQTSAKLNFCLFGSLIKNMTILQRFSGFVYTICSFGTLFLTASLFTMPIVLASGGTLVPFAHYDQLKWLIRFCFFALITNRMTEYIMYLPAGYRMGQREAAAMMWMAPFHAIAIVRSFLLPSWLGGKVAAFSSSGSITSELNERDAATRAPLVRRLRVILIDCMAGMHLIYITFAVSAVAVSTARAWYNNTNAVDPSNPTRDEVLVYLLVHGGWPPMLWFMALISCWTPINYALFPPTMPDREELLDRDPVTLVAHPTEEAKKTKWDKRSWFHEFLYAAFTAYSTAMFVGSWYFPRP